MDEDAETMAAAALFRAYNEAGPNPWKTHDGKDVPVWSDLSAQDQGKWRAAARSVRPAPVNWSEVRRDCVRMVHELSKTADPATRMQAVRLLADLAQLPGWLDISP